MNVFSLISVALLFAIHCANATGSWSSCSDLDQVKSDVASIDDDLRTLFTSEAIDIESTDTITVLSANCQVVNGMNYAVTTNFGVITYHVAPSASASPDTLSYIGSTSRITGGYSDYDDLSQVSTDLDKVRSDIHSLLIANSMDVADDDNIVVLSAQSQVVAGTNFVVHMNIGSYTNVILSYFIALPSTDADQIPSNLKLIDAGMKRVGSYSDIADLSEVQSQIDSIDDELRDLLSNEGLDIVANDTISVVSAQSQIVAGTNYKVTINAGSYSDVIISYFVGLAEVIPPPITDLKVLDIGHGGEILLGGWDTVTSDDELDEIRATVESMADQIISLLQSADMDIVDSAQIIVQSAESQVVAGTNYRVNVAVGAYIDVIIQYFMGIPLLVMGAPVTYPLNLQLIHMGSKRASTSAVGSYNDISDLSAVETTISTIESDIRSLLVSEGLAVGDSDTISVVSAQSQVVAGTNYRVTLNVGLMEGVIVQYFVDLPVNDAEQTPSNLQLIDLGIGGVDNLGSYQTMSYDELDLVVEQVHSIRDEIIALLQDNNFAIDNDPFMSVLSAQYQVVAGTNYKVTMDVGYYRNVIISYYVPLSTQTPTDLKLIDNGEMVTEYAIGSYSEISDLSGVETQITNMDDELRTLLVSEGFTVGDTDDISVVSAESQIVAGTNYRVKINIGSNQQAMIGYYVGLDDPTPTGLKVLMKLQLDAETGTMGGYESVSDLDAVKETVQGIESDIIALLQRHLLDVDDDAIVMVTSAQSQVVAGTNYAVTMSIGQYKDVVVGYFVPLPSSDADQTPTSLHLIDPGYSRMDSSVGSYTEVSDLSSVKSAVSSIESDIRSLLVTEGLAVEDDDEIDVVSAESQVVAGTNYRVTIDVGSLLEDVIISYFVDLPVNDAEQTPSNLKLIDLGTSITLVDTPSEIETTASSDSSADSSDAPLQDEEQSVDNIMAIGGRDWIIFGSVLVSVAACICLLCVAMKKKQNKRTAGNELYASLNHDDAIDETL